MEPHHWELRIYVMAQGPLLPDPLGVRKCNEALDLVKSGWVFTFADDTTQHPALFRRLWEIIQANPHAGCVIFTEARGGSVFSIHEADPATGFICGGSLAYEISFLGNLRFDTDDPLHRTDGRLVSRLWSKDPSRFIKVDEILTRENSLQWKEPVI